MFVFIIPRTPTEYQNPLRNQLWKICYSALLNQTSINWKAVVVSETYEEIYDNKQFIYLKDEGFSKEKKLEIALDYIKKNKDLLTAEYLIRLDDDDIISPSFLKSIEDSSQKMDCYADKYHVCIDPIYRKISYRKNAWLPNTIIHKYEHAIKQCGPTNTSLITQDHSKYWHIYYADKKTFLTNIKLPLYYRILTPSSVTSKTYSEKKNQIDSYSAYINGYGPWINIPYSFIYTDKLVALSDSMSADKYPEISFFNCITNYLRYFKMRIKNL